MDPSLAATFLPRPRLDRAANAAKFREPKREALRRYAPLEAGRWLLRGLLAERTQRCQALTYFTSDGVTCRRQRAGLPSVLPRSKYEPPPSHVTRAPRLHLLGVIAFAPWCWPIRNNTEIRIPVDDLIVVSPLTDKELAAQAIMGLT